MATPNPEYGEYLTPAECANLTRRSVGGLANDRSARIGLPYYRVGGRVLYRRSEVVQFIEAGRVAVA